MKKATDLIGPLNWSPRQRSRWLAGTLLAGVSMTALAGNPWFTGRTVGGETKPILLMSPSATQNVSPLVVSKTAAFNGGLVDVVVSLYNNPQGDNDGNTQGNPLSEQDIIEQIIQYWADGMYEATQGAHRLRKVRIYRNGRNADKADVVWVASVHPNAPASGVNQAGGHINFADTFPGGNPDGSNHEMLTDQIGAGYTLAHEWGHYAYGLFDEYKLDTTDVPVVPSIMNSQWNAKGGDNRWLNYSIANNGGGDFQNTLHTFQHCNYSASCWEVLARMPASDPFQYPASSGCTYRLAAPRIFYPELAAVAPAGNATPGIDLPSAAARGSLDIIWASDNLVLQIVIDHSGSMDFEPNKMSNARAAAKLLVDQAGTGNAVIGVIKFDDVVEIVYPLTQVTDANVQTAIKAAIDTISPNNATAIYDAASVALTGLQNLQTVNDTKVVFLLTDGLDNSSTVSAATVIANSQNAQVPIFTFGYGSDADASALQALASQTGGRFYSSPTTLSDISSAFGSAFVNASSVVGVDSGSQTATVSPQGVPFTVDASLSVLNLTITHAGTPNAVTLQLLDPNGNSHAPQSVAQSGGETVEFFSLSGPMSGVWHLVTSASGGPVVVNYQVVGVPGASTVTAGLRSENGEAIIGPTPLILEARLDQGLGVVGAVVSGIVKQPDGSQAAVQFRDDGVAPDGVAGDGIYTVRFSYTQNGVYDFTVRFNNNQGTASFTYIGANLSPRVDGTAAPVLPVGGPVGFNFSRSATTRVTVNGVVAPAVETLSQILNTNIDRQAGLFYQQVVVTNSGSATVSGFRLSVTNLPAGAWCVSATGTNAGVPFVEFSGSLVPDQTVTFNLAYYNSTRTAPVGVGVSVEAVVVTPPPSGSGQALAIRRAFLRPDGKFAVEFDTLAGRTYVVEYSSDMTNWKQAQPAVLGTGSRLMWVDSGPPQTESPPASGPRFYRLVLLPQ